MTKFVPKVDQQTQTSVRNPRENSPKPPKKKDVSTQTVKQIIKIGSLKLVAIILILGLTYTAARNFLDYLEHDMCIEKEFYQCQKIIEPNVIEMAKEPAKKYADEIKQDTIISIDSAWK